MKVLFTIGGIPHYSVRLIEEINHKGVDLVMVVPERRSKTIGEGVKVEEKGQTFRMIHTPEKQMWYQKAGFQELPNILEKERPDILISGYPYFLQFFFDRKLREVIKKRNIRLIIREIPFQIPPYGKLYSYNKTHSLYDEERRILNRGILPYLRNYLLMKIRRFCYLRATATLNYASCAQDLLPGYGVDPERIFVTYNATDAEALWREELQVKKETPILDPGICRIVHIGRLVKWKRVDLLIKAFGKIADRFPDAELLIIGNGPEKKSLEKQAANAGLSARVKFIGAVYDSFSLGRYMHVSSIYVLAGMGGLSINDAMAYSLPVVCSVCDGTERDLVLEGKTGLFFSENDAADLAEKIAYLLEHPEKRTAMGKNGRELIEQKINIDTVSDNFIKAFRFAMDHPNKR